MYKNLDNYLEEISHFLGGRDERGEILAEIRSHILEKAEREAGGATETALAKVISAYGTPRRVAEKYLEGSPLIAPAFSRFLFRYTALLFAIHLAFTVFAVIFKRSFVIFPFLFMPRLSAFEAVIYLPMAFLADFGAVALLLYFITRSGKEVRLPWPKFAPAPEAAKPVAGMSAAARIATMVGAGAMLALTGAAVAFFIKFRTIFFVSLNFREFCPLFMPLPGLLISLAVIIMLTAATLGLFFKLSAVSRRTACWLDVALDGLALVVIGLVLRLQFGRLFAFAISPAFLPKVRFALAFLLLFMALMIAIDLVTNLARLGRGRLKK